MMVRLGIPTALAVVFMLLAVPLASDVSDASADQTYRSQLDDNGKEVYDELARLVGNYDNTAKISVVLDSTVLFESQNEAEEYGRAVAYNAMAARYFTDPTIVHLWDLPVFKPEVKVATSPVTVTAKSGDGMYFMAVSLDFALTVPDNMKDDLTTSQNELKEKVDEIMASIGAKEFKGDTQYLVRDVASYLGKVKVADDEEGKVSNIYDALVLKKSSSAGIAAAFTAICSFNNVDAVTVKGDSFKGNSPEDSEVRFWNEVGLDGKWYAVDAVEHNKSRSSGFMMAGTTSETVRDKTVMPFGLAYETDMDLSAENSLEAPQIDREGFQYPDETPFLMKYGPFLILALIGIILVGTIWHAMKHGSL